MGQAGFSSMPINDDKNIWDLDEPNFCYIMDLPKDIRTFEGIPNAFHFWVSKIFRPEYGTNLTETPHITM